MLNLDCPYESKIKLSVNPDKYEKKGIYLNYLANYENGIAFIEVYKLIKEFFA